MLGSNWRKDLEFGLIVAACVLIVALPISGLMLNEYANVHRTNATYQQNAERDRQAASEEISKTCFKTDFDAFSVCIKEKIASYYKQQATNEDLQAQQDMAHWAKTLFFLGIVQLVVSGFGIVLVIRSLRYTRKATNAAVRANRNTASAIDQERTHAQMGLRAYVSVLPDGIGLMSRRSDIVGHVLIKNVGQVIATNVSLVVMMDRVPARHRDQFSFQGSQISVGALVPTVEIQFGSTPMNDKFLYSEQPTPSFIYVWGRVSYNNGFDSSECHTYFCHRYSVSSKSIHKGRYIITKERARFHNFGNSAT